MSIPQNELEAVQNAPLFLPRYLQKQITVTPPIPAQHLEIIQRWQELMADNTRDRKSTRLNSSHSAKSRMPSSA